LKKLQSVRTFKSARSWRMIAAISMSRPMAATSFVPGRTGMITAVAM